MKSSFGILAGICASCVLSVPSGASDSDIWVEHNATDFEILGQHLGLSSSRIDSLIDRISQSNTSIDSLESACLTVGDALGEAQVDMAPLNQSLVDVNWSETCQASPYCIIQPRDAADVSKSIQVIRYFEIPFAVRSGGHSPNPGWSSIGSQGILLDMGRLNTVDMSTDRTFATVGASARWGDVYTTLNATEAAVVGGRVPSVGVGGLILGGGYSYVSDQFGLAADNVKNFEVVLANGTIVDANSNSNSDLFWALKGGGPNFGIVTQFELYTIPTYVFWAAAYAYSTDQALDILAAFDQWQVDGASDTSSSISLVISLDLVIVAFLYSEPSQEQPNVFAPFNEIEPLEVFFPPANTTLADVAKLAEATYPLTTQRHDYRGHSSRIDTNLTQSMYDFWRERAIAVHDTTGANQTFAVQHVRENLAQQGLQKGGNPLNIPQGAMQWWTTLIDWENEEDDETVRAVSIDTTARWEELGQERGSQVPFLFMNDASRDQNPLALYGSESIEKLKQIAQIYDADQTFQTLQYGGFLLAEV